MLAYIYTLSDPRNGNIRYVGKTNNPKLRLWMHQRETRNTRKNAWIKSLAPAALSPAMDIIEELPHDPDSLWEEAERFWIKFLRFLGCDLTNEDDGGGSGFRKSEHSKHLIRMKATGRKMSQSAIEKMKESKRANLTPEVRERMRLAQLGKRRTPEQKAARSARMMGHYVSEETKQKIRDAKKGKPLHPNTYTARAIACTGRIKTPEEIAKRLATIARKKLLALTPISS